MLRFQVKIASFCVIMRHFTSSCITIKLNSETRTSGRLNYITRGHRDNMIASWMNKVFGNKKSSQDITEGNVVSSILQKKQGKNFPGF